MKYIISGVALSGNKGASGMTESIIQNISAIDSSAYFRIFSYYPGSDRKMPCPHNAEIIDGSPKNTVLLFFASIFCLFLRMLFIPPKNCVFGTMKKIADSDCWIDASGISFVDGREKFLIFNILSVLPAFAVGCPVIKAPQAMGPFKHFINRTAARIFLPRFRIIAARGKKTMAYLSELNLKNLVLFSDCAFSLKCTDNDMDASLKYISSDAKHIIGVSPSQVVWKLCENTGVDYLGILKECVEKWLDSGAICVIFPHSARKGVEKTHNNDLPLINKFAAMLHEHKNLIIVKDELSAGELRCLISKFDILVASRFHAIISAVAAGVPPVVIGWSHKYAEVLEPFALDKYVIGYDSISSGRIIECAGAAATERESISANEKKVTSDIVSDNMKFFRIVVKTAEHCRKNT